MSRNRNTAGQKAGEGDKPNTDTQAAPQGEAVDVADDATDTSQADEPAAAASPAAGPEPAADPEPPAAPAPEVKPTPAPPRAPSADDLVLAKGPEGCDSANWNGQVFDADNGGVFELPVAAFADLQAHGFTAYVDEQPAE